MSKRFLIGAVFGAAAWAQCDFQTALRQHQAGDLEAAAAGYEACIAADPHRVDARSNLGVVLVKLGRYQDAIKEYKAALEWAPPDVAPRLHFNLGLAYYKSSQIAEAASEFEALHAGQPADLNLALLLADCRLRQGEYQRAIDVAAPLESAHLEDPALNYVLGMALIRAGRVAEGQIRVDRILRRGESAEGHFLLGSALFNAGDIPRP